jgi:hypothetical protein
VELKYFEEICIYLFAKFFHITGCCSINLKFSGINVQYVDSETILRPCDSILSSGRWTAASLWSFAAAGAAKVKWLEWRLDWLWK